MGWTGLIIIFFGIGFVPGITFRLSRRILLIFGASVTAIYLVGMVSLPLWAIDCRDCVAIHGFEETVVLRSEVFSSFWKLSTATAGSLLLGLGMGAGIRALPAFMGR